MAISKISLSQTGPSFSRIVHGVWRLREWNYTAQELLRLINYCVDLGITTFDNADIYGNYTCEQLFGNALILESGIRNKIQIVTKCGIRLKSENRPENNIKYYDTGKTHILRSVENSLTMMNTDYIDLLLIHRPDFLMNADETAEAFNLLKKEGKVLHFGVSNFLPHQFDLLQSRLDFPLVTNQIEVSVANLEMFENGVVDHMQKLRIAPMVWSPFAGGRLFTENSERMDRIRTAMHDIAAEFENTSIDVIALAWLLNHPVNFIPILGTGNLDRIKNSIRAEEIILTPEQWYMIWIASKGGDVP